MCIERKNNRNIVFTKVINMDAWFYRCIPDADSLRNKRLF